MSRKEASQMYLEVACYAGILLGDLSVHFNYRVTL